MVYCCGAAVVRRRQRCGGGPVQQQCTGALTEPSSPVAASNTVTTRTVRKRPPPRTFPLGACSSYTLSLKTAGDLLVAAAAIRATLRAAFVSHARRVVAGVRGGVRRRAAARGVTSKRRRGRASCAAGSRGVARCRARRFAARKAARKIDRARSTPRRQAPQPQARPARPVGAMPAFRPQVPGRDLRGQRLDRRSENHGY